MGGRGGEGYTLPKRNNFTDRAPTLATAKSAQNDSLGVIFPYPCQLT